MNKSTTDKIFEVLAEIALIFATVNISLFITQIWKNTLGNYLVTIFVLIVAIYYKVFIVNKKK